MLPFFGLLGSLYLLGALAMFLGMRFAPEGYEDEAGFQVVWQNNGPEIGNVACVWAFSAAHGQA